MMQKPKRKTFIKSLKAVWNRKNFFSLVQAAYLWEEFLPPPDGSSYGDMPQKVNSRIVLMCDAIARDYVTKIEALNCFIEGECGFSKYDEERFNREALEYSNAAKNYKYFSIKRDKSALKLLDETQINRPSLIGWATLINEFPIFLFPEKIDAPRFKKSFPPESKWKNFKFVFEDNENVRVYFKNRNCGLASAGDMMLLGNRKPLQEWILFRSLVVLIESGKPAEITTTAKNKMRVDRFRQRLSLALKSYFGIDDPPFIKSKEIKYTWIPAFKIRHKND